MHIDGFLSPHAPQSPPIGVAKSAAVRNLVEKVNRFAVQVFTRARTAPKTAEEMLPFALAARLLQDFESSILLAERGFRAQSRAMARSTLESALFCTAACRDILLTRGTQNKPTRFIDAVLAAHEQHRRKAAKELAQLPQTSSEVKTRLSDVYAGPDIAELCPTINVKGLADDLELGPFYTVLYRPLSQDSHPSATSIEHHIVSDGGTAIDFRIGPDYAEYSDTVLASVASMLIGVDAYLVKYGDDSERQANAEIVLAYQEVAS